MLHERPTKLIILGAGKPFEGETHSSLRTVRSHQSIMDWLIDVFKDVTSTIEFVGGYQFEKLATNYPTLHFTLNPNWKNTASIFSLKLIKLEPAFDYYICYADILFRKELLTIIEAADHCNISAALDFSFPERYLRAGATAPTIYENIEDNTFLRYGQKKSSPQFIGLMKIPKQCVAVFSEILHSAPDNCHLSYLVNMVVRQGFEVNYLDAASLWTDLDVPNGLTNFIFGTKADTLERLSTQVKKSKILDSVKIKFGDWLVRKDFFINEILERFIGSDLAIRSSAIVEDTFISSNAGVFDSYLGVVNDPEKIEEAIIKIFESYSDENSLNQILIQPMLYNVRCSGVIFTRTMTNGAPYYVINYSEDGKTDSITSGQSNDYKTTIVYRNTILSNLLHDSYLNSLMEAIREIERLVDYDVLDIEFALSNENEVYILQVRPLTTVTEQFEVLDQRIAEALETAQRYYNESQLSNPFIMGEKNIYGVMPDWNPAEMIGIKPRALAYTLYSYLITNDVWAQQRAEYGYRDVRPHPLMKLFCGQPYIDVRASFNSFVPANVSDKLAGKIVNSSMDYLAENPQLHDKVEFAVMPNCRVFDFQHWREKLKIRAGLKENELKILEEGLSCITINAISRLQKDLEGLGILQKRLNKIEKKEIPPLQKAIILLDDCKRFGTIAFAHLARAAFIATSFLRSSYEVGILKKERVNNYLSSIKTISHDLSLDAYNVKMGCISFQFFCEKYGHLRPGTYDITSLKYSDAAESYLLPLIDNATEYNHLHFSWDLQERAYLEEALAELGYDINLEKFENFTRVAIWGREYSKFVFTKNLSYALDNLIQAGELHNLSKEELADISYDDFIKANLGNINRGNLHDFLKNCSENNKKNRGVVQSILLPPLLTSQEQFYVFTYPAAKPNFITNNKVTSQLLYVDAQENTLELKGKIVLIEKADPGYDWIFSHNISGLITMYGGANSHMAIRASEFSLPAAIGVGEMFFEKLKKAKIIEINCCNEQIIFHA